MTEIPTQTVDEEPTEDERGFAEDWATNVLENGDIDPEVVEARELLAMVESAVGKNEILQLCDVRITSVRSVDKHIKDRRESGLAHLNELLRLYPVTVKVSGESGESIGQLESFEVGPDGGLHPIVEGELVMRQQCSVIKTEAGDE